MKRIPKENNKRHYQQPYTSPEERDNYMINLAIDCAEEQLRNGTASSQVITHYLKLASERERLELEILQKQRELIVAKTEELHTAKRVEELYENAMAAFRSYSPTPDSNENQDV